MKLEYKWICPVCNDVFKTRRYLREHVKQENHYKNKLKIEWICPLCNEKFESRRKLQKHRADEHNGKK